MGRMIYIHRKLKTHQNTFVYKFILRSVYFALFIVALLGPSFGKSTKEVKSIGKDIMVCVDLSASMNANDVQPTRLEKVKFELKNIVNAFNSDRIGIIIFSSQAFVQCPLTLDQSALHLFIETLSTNLVPDAGTNFSPPLEMALKKLGNEESSVSQQKSKIIILISDGEDFGENTSSVVSQIESEDIKLYTLGVGTEQGSRILTASGYKTDKKGQEVISRLNSDQLKEIAINTGGKYFEINDEKNDVEKLINTISMIEGELRDAKQIDVSTNKYFYFLLGALVLMMIDGLFKFKLVSV